MEETSYVFLFTFFSLSLIFTLVAASISHFLNPATKFYVVPPKNFLYFFYLALALFLVEHAWPVVLLSLFLCLSLSLFSKFVDMTINLNLIL